ncbi:MAG TPA: hypothetical protein VEV82_11270, partial [Actinomycetota bacterium]|nr:hypothetical protein [Actinomycetota bacterium]
MLIVMLPLFAAAIVVHSVVVGEVRDRAEIALQPALNTVLAGYNGRAPYIDGLVERTLSSKREVGRALAQKGPELEAFLSERVGPSSGIDFLVVLDENGRPIESASLQPQFVKGAERPAPQEIAEAAMTGSMAGP